MTKYCLFVLPQLFYSNPIPVRWLHPVLVLGHPIYLRKKRRGSTRSRGISYFISRRKQDREAFTELMDSCSLTLRALVPTGNLTPKKYLNLSNKRLVFYNFGLCNGRVTVTLEFIKLFFHRNVLKLCVQGILFFFF